MKRNRKKEQILIKAVSFTGLLCPLAFRLVVHSSLPVSANVALSLFIAGSALLYLPVPGEFGYGSYVFALLLIPAIAALCLSLVSPPWICMYTVACNCVYMSRACRLRYSNLRRTFSRGGALKTVFFETKLVSCMALVFCGFSAVLAKERPLIWLAALASLAVYLRLVTGSAEKVVVGSDKLEKIRSTAAMGSGMMGLAAGNQDPVSVDSQRFKNLVKHFVEDKPFLKEKLSLNYVARFLVTNRTKASEIIHDYFGGNYSQFVNHFKLNHAVELMEKDQKMPVSDVASFSAFHSLTTFNAVFKKEYNMTPSEYKRKCSAEKLRQRLSSPEEQEPSDPFRSSSQGG